MDPIPTFKVQSPIQLLHSEAKVEEFIDANTGSWIERLIHQILKQEEVKKICSLTVSRWRVKIN